MFSVSNLERVWMKNSYPICYATSISINAALQFESLRLYIQNTNILKICFSPHIAAYNTHRFSRQTGALWAHSQHARICMSVFHHQIHEHRCMLDFTCRHRAHLLRTARNVLFIQRLIFLEIKCSLTQNSTLLQVIEIRGGERGGAGV